VAQSLTGPHQFLAYEDQQFLTRISNEDLIKEADRKLEQMILEYPGFDSLPVKKKKLLVVRFKKKIFAGYHEEQEAGEQVLVPTADTTSSVRVPSINGKKNYSFPSPPHSG
jgi:hypothetical protein